MKSASVRCLAELISAGRAQLQRAQLHNYSFNSKQHLSTICIAIDKICAAFSCYRMLATRPSRTWMASLPLPFLHNQNKRVMLCVVYSLVSALNFTATITTFLVGDLSRLIHGLTGGPWRLNHHHDNPGGLSTLAWTPTHSHHWVTLSRKVKPAIQPRFIERAADKSDTEEKSCIWP